MSKIMHPEVFTKAMSRHTAEMTAGGNGTLEYLKAYRETYEDLARGEPGVLEYLVTLDKAILSWESGRKPDFNHIDMPMTEEPVTLYEKLIQRVTKWRRALTHYPIPSGEIPDEQSKGSFFIDAKGSPDLHRSLEKINALVRNAPADYLSFESSATDPAWLSLAVAEHGVLTPEKVDAIIESDAGANHPLLRALQGGQGTDLERKVAALHYLVFTPECQGPAGNTPPA